MQKFYEHTKESIKAVSAEALEEEGTEQLKYRQYWIESTRKTIKGKKTKD